MQLHSNNSGNYSPIQNGFELVHDDPRNVDLFAEMGRVEKTPLFDQRGTPLQGFHGLRNTVTGELLNSPPVTSGYKLVNHADVYGMHGAQLFRNAELPHDNLTVIDRVFDGGRRATRQVMFNDMTWDIDGKGNGITARADIVNSTDMSWAFQVFSGAYREYCRNTCVFGGQKAYHQKRKHTSQLSTQAMIEKAHLGLSMYNNHRDTMNNWRTIDLDRSQWVQVLEETLCKKGGKGAELSTDKSTRVNGKLLDYLTLRFDEESRELGSNLWAAYNSLTHWATHTDETFERQNDDGSVTELSTSRAGSNPFTVQHTRNDKVRAFLESDQWANLERVA
jgi:hypothetical protein